MVKLENRTTEEHFNKFRDISIKAGISFKNSTLYMGFTKDGLLKLYMEDNLLNNIPLQDFDCIYLFLPLHVKRIITNPSYNVNVYKHLLIYEVLGAIPIFVENGKTIKDTPPLKK